MPHVPAETIYTDTEPRPDWLIPDTIHRGSQVLLAALAGVGKSMFCYALGNALATGAPFLDANPSPICRTLYFDEENSVADLSAYARWTWRGLGCPPRDRLAENFRIESLTLRSADQWDRALKASVARFRPDLIVIDTATPACRLKNENDNAEATEASGQIRAAQALGAPGCAAIVLKHLRYDAVTGRMDIRGAKAWNGGVDAIWFHLSRPGRKNPDGYRNTYIRPEKVRAYGLRETLSIEPTVFPQREVRLKIIRGKD